MSFFNRVLIGSLVFAFSLNAVAAPDMCKRMLSRIDDSKLILRQLLHLESGRQVYILTSDTDACSVSRHEAYPGQIARRVALGITGTGLLTSFGCAFFYALDPKVGPTPAVISTILTAVFGGSAIAYANMIASRVPRGSIPEQLRIHGFAPRQIQTINLAAAHSADWAADQIESRLMRDGPQDQRPLIIVLRPSTNANEKRVLPPSVIEELESRGFESKGFHDRRTGDALGTFAEESSE